MKDRILIGVIVRPHGIKGLVVVHSMCQNALDLSKYKNIFDDNHESITIKIIRNLTEHTVLASIKECDNRNIAETFVHKKLYVNKQDFPTLGQDEYYLWQFEGLNVLDNTSQKIVGKVIVAEDFGGGTFLTIRVLSKPSESSFSAGGAERRSGVYSNVHEHSSTEQTNRKIDSEELRKNSIIDQKKNIVTMPLTNESTTKIDFENQKIWVNKLYFIKDV